MTTPSFPVAQQKPSKSSGISGCVVTGFAIFLAILGAYDLVFGSVSAYIFSSAHMLSPTNITILLIIACDCFIYFFLAFRVKRQHWLFSLALLGMVWLIFPLPLRAIINTSTARVRNDGYSMGASLPDKSYILADKLVYRQSDPQRSDIVIFSFPSDLKQSLIKRVIGLPGETIVVQDGIVTINGALLEEPYVTDPPLYNGTWVVPDGQYFVLGDNRNESRDSHQWGFLPREHIIAKAVWIYYPLDHFGRIVDVNYQP